MFISGTGVFNMIDHLEDEKPLIRHSAREWLFEALNSFKALMCPLLSVFEDSINQ